MKKNIWINNLLLESVDFRNGYQLVFMCMLGVGLPFLLVTYIKNSWFIDIANFDYWANCWGENIYLNCPKTKIYYSYPNYPAIGMLLSAGAIKAIRSVSGISDVHTLSSIFRYYLAFFDALNFLLYLWLTNLMNFRFPILIAAAIAIIPSTWVGDAVWGQIDNISLFFCLLSSICFF